MAVKAAQSAGCSPDSEGAVETRQSARWLVHPAQWPHAAQTTVILVLIALLLWAIALTLGPDQAFIVGSAGVAAKLICMYLDTRVKN
jgi:inner membrane protein involved in colicin E2 resistance